jgi:hypothetical protein
MKPNINSVELHPQLSINGHPVDGALVGAGSNVHSQTVLTSVKKLFLLPKRSSNIKRQTVSSFNISQCHLDAARENVIYFWTTLVPAIV